MVVKWPDELKIDDVKLNTEPCEFSTINKFTRKYKTKENYTSWEKALSKIGIAYRDARASLEKRHEFFRRSLIARPIEARNENISSDISKGRHPKPFFLSVKKNEQNQYYGQIISLPIKFYESSNAQNYMDVINDIHQKFSESLMEVK